MNTVKLSKPIKHGSVVIEELNFKEPSAEILDELPANPTLMKQGDFMRAAASLSGESKSVIDKLHVKDRLAVMDALSFLMFFGKSDET